MPSVFIVSALRTPVGKAPNGRLRTVRSDELTAHLIRETLRRTPAVTGAEVEDVFLGCAMPEGAQSFNVARVAGQLAGLPDMAAGVTINRFCASGLEAVAMAAQRIAAGTADLLLAGGVESMSQVPMFGHRTTLNPALVDTRPEAYLSMGLTAENVAKRYAISRADQDAFAFSSHRKALDAIAAGRFRDECVPVPVREVGLNGKEQRTVAEFLFDTDEGPRDDTTMEKLAGLKPAFSPTGTVTAGTSSQRSDGAALLLLASEALVRSRGLKPIARFVTYAVGGVAPEIMGIGPVTAIPRALRQAGLTLDDIDLIELNEAFAAQSLAVIRECGLPEDRTNVNGGAIALGHPLGASGAKLAVTLLHELRLRGGRRGVVSLCVGGGMGVAGIFEMLPSR